MGAKRSRLSASRKAAGHTQESLAEMLSVDRTTVVRWEAGDTTPQPSFRPKLAKALRVSPNQLGELLSNATNTLDHLRLSAPTDDLYLVETLGDTDNGEQAALELARRVAASDVSAETLDRLEQIVNDLAIAYPTTPPQKLVSPVRRHLSYVTRLVDARKTLHEHRRLLVVGGWLSLLAATLNIDLEQRAAARGWLATTASLAQQTGHAEIHAWRYETEAWQVLTDGDYRQALDLAQAAQQVAPRASSAGIQATAQEGRAWARLGQARETYDALNRVERFVSRMTQPDQPEHHYRYDPDKAEAYVATTLAWLGDVAAEHYAREVVAKLTAEVEAGRWPRRLASANVDLALALLLTDRLDEACAAAQAAMLSGRLVASNHWRALEVVKAVETRGLPEAAELREAYETLRQPESSPDDNGSLQLFDHPIR